MTTYGRSPWLDQFPKSRVPSYPKHRGGLEADVVIVGGGLTGCATAYALAAAGMRAVLLERDRIGRGATAYASGWISDDPGVPFDALEKAIGLRAARHVAQSWRRSALDFSALLRRLDIKCYPEPRKAITVATTPEQAAQLKRDLKSRRAAGLDAPFLSSRVVKTEAALDSEGGLRGNSGATIDPFRACVGLAAAAASKGADLFEQSEVRRITFTRKHADVVAAGGTIRTRRVVVATAMPTSTLFRSLARHFWFHTAFFASTDMIPARVRQQLGRRTSVVRDLAAPPHMVRWLGEDRLLIAGADTERVPDRLRARTVLQRTGQLMYELSTLYPEISGIQPEYGWSADYARTVDGLPYIGAHRNFPHHLFVFGDASHGVTGAYLASRILVRQCSGEMDPADEAFGFHR
jgi:glycine/D-amino acid oxidase-like deaminating enzyme